MPRSTRQEIDEEILDAAAALFARHGMDHTSLQRVADATGYSKTGLLHRFPTKEALQEATVALTLTHLRRIVDGVDGTPPGAARDEAVITALVDLALARPGATALALSSVSRAPDGSWNPDDLADAVFGAFAAPPDVDAERAVRLTACLGGLAVASLACPERHGADTVRPLLVAAAVDALGHRAAPTSPSPDAPEPEE